MSNPVIIEETIKAGEPLEIVFSHWENGYESPITGYPLSIVMRRDKIDGAQVAQWIDGDPAVTRVDATGKVTLRLSATFTESLKAQSVFLDSWIKNDSTGDGIKSGVVKLIIDRGVSR